MRVSLVCSSTKEAVSYHISRQVTNLILAAVVEAEEAGVKSAQGVASGAQVCVEEPPSPSYWCSDSPPLGLLGESPGDGYPGVQRCIFASPGPVMVWGLPTRLLRGYTPPQRAY